MAFSNKLVAAHLKRGEFDDVDRLCREAIANDQSNAEAWHMRALAAMGKDAPDRAVQYILRANFHRPADCAILINLGIILSRLERYDEAGRAFEEAAQLFPGAYEAQFSLASHYFDQEKYAAAETALDATLALRPESAAAWDLRARTFRKLDDHDRALNAARRALRIDSDLAISHRIVADALMRKQEYEESYKHYVAALELDPEDGEARGNLALLLTRMGRHAEAAEHYRQAIVKIPEDLRTRHGLSIALLALGQLEDGWPLYSARTWHFDSTPPVKAPLLERLPTSGERVLLTTDQGPGEEIMFASMLPDLIRTGAELTVVCGERMVPLFARSFPSVRFVARRQPINAEFDRQFALADTAQWLRRRFDDFPSHAGYLKVDSDLAVALREKYRAGSRAPLIGISWSTIAGAKISTQKTIPLDLWGPILGMPGVRFVSLQYGEAGGNITAAEQAFGVRIIQDPSIDPLYDMDSFASQVASVDLVITTSNTTAHVAGGLNVPTWVFVPIGFGGLWHWFLERRDSPWYPSVRLFRQAVRGDWKSSVAEVSERLSEFTHGGASDT